MKANVGAIDRLFRLIAAGLLVAFFFTNMEFGISGAVVLFVAAILALTAFVSFCPIYRLVGINSLSSKRKNDVK